MKPIKKKWFGNRADEEIQLTVITNDGEIDVERQKGRNKFLLVNGKTVRLVNKTADLLDNEGYMETVNEADETELVAYIKQNHVFTFENNKYNWIVGKTPVLKEGRLKTKDYDHDPLANNPRAPLAPGDVHLVEKARTTTLHRSGALIATPITKLIIYARLKMPRFGDIFTIRTPASSVSSSVALFNNGAFYFSSARNIENESLITMQSNDGGFTYNETDYYNLLTSIDVKTGRTSYSYVDDILGEASLPTAFTPKEIILTDPNTFMVMGSTWNTAGAAPNAANLESTMTALYCAIDVDDDFDISDEQTRRLFYDVNGNQTDLSGCPDPIVKMTGNSAAWTAGTNEGSLGNFILLGPDFT